MPVIFTPDNEPYLGRELLLYFDRLIVAAMEQNLKTAPRSHGHPLSDQQLMAAQVIPQTLSIALSIRELIRQGYLFGAHVLLRPMVERATMLLYLSLHPNEIERWKRGWLANDAPSLAKMLDAIQAKGKRNPATPGWELTSATNSLLHGKPDSAKRNLIPLGGNSVGHATSKILNRPGLCDELCGQLVPWLVVVQAVMTAYFPSDRP